MDVPYLDPEEIRGAARELRERAFDGETPIPVDLDALLYDYLYDEHDVAFYDDRRLDDSAGESILGVTFPRAEKIYVDAELADDAERLGRYRFTVAHEIGHWVLHRPLVTDGEAHAAGADDLKFVTFERDVVGGDGESADYRPEEWQANAFAIWLLLPDDLLAHEFGARFSDPPVHWDVGWSAPDHADEPLRAYSRALAATPKGGRPPLNERFLLSVEATAIALEERGYVESAD